jgi:hypothetical protein
MAWVGFCWQWSDCFKKCCLKLPQPQGTS